MMGRLDKSVPTFLPNCLGMGAAQVHGTFLAIWVVFLGPTCLAKLVGIFLRDIEKWKAFSRRSFLAISVGFWGPIMMPQLPKIFPNNHEKFKPFAQ